MSWASTRVDRLHAELETMLRHGQYSEALGELVERLAHAVDHRARTARWLMLCACGLDSGMSKRPATPDADARPRLVLVGQTMIV